MVPSGMARILTVSPAPPAATNCLARWPPWAEGRGNRPRRRRYRAPATRAGHRGLSTSRGVPWRAPASLPRSAGRQARQAGRSPVRYGPGVGGRQLTGTATSQKPDAGRLQGMTGKQPFEAVVTKHGLTVLRVCRAVLGPADADDAWSETFLAAMRAYPDLPADANVEAWLVTIAHRKAIDITRATARRAVPVADVPEGRSGAAADGDASGLDGDLAEAVARLPEKQKQAVAYHYLAGLPYADIAAIVGGSAEAARRAAADGIAALRRAYPRLQNKASEQDARTRTKGEAREHG